MRKMIILLLAALLLSGCADAEPPRLCQNSPLPIECEVRQVAEQNDPPPDAPDIDPTDDTYQRAVWISYIDMAKLIADTEEEFRGNIARAFDSVSDLGLNIVYVHIRAFGDAYYISRYFVPARIVPTEEGTMRYDPLKIMTELAHERGLSIHGWINPLRCDTAANMERKQGTMLYEWYVGQDAFPEYLTMPDGDEHYWLNPAFPEVRRFIADGVREICEGYDIDGIHIDDYFYPTTDKSFDEKAYAAAETELSLSEWRLDNCSKLVKEIHDAVKDTDGDILFGVSPQGNIDNNYTKMYADVKLWCGESGYIDYIAPQIYFGYENAVCPFEDTLREWRGLCTDPSVKLICGLAMYKVGGDPEFADDTGIIARQIADSAAAGYDGFAVYSFDSLFDEGGRQQAERAAIAEEITKE